MVKKNVTSISDIVRVNATNLFPDDEKDLSECIANQTANLENYINKYKITSYMVTARTTPSHATQKYFVKIVARVHGQNLIVEESSNGEVTICKAYKKASLDMKKRIYKERDKFIESKRKPYS